MARRSCPSGRQRGVLFSNFPPPSLVCGLVSGLGAVHFVGEVEASEGAEALAGLAVAGLGGFDLVVEEGDYDGLALYVIWALQRLS